MKARRADVEVFFDNVDISTPLRKNFLSLVYTDNEEDEADDIQIRIEDRAGVWLTQWLDSSEQEPEPEPEEEVYKVIAPSGLNIRSGPSTDSARLGGFSYGAEIEVQSVSGGWASIEYGDKIAYVNADWIQKVEHASISEPSTKGISIRASIIDQDDGEKVLDCGSFELDAVDAMGPPSTITIKGTSLPFSSQIRQTRKSKAWEAYNLSKIAEEIAYANGMSCLYDSSDDPYYARVEQTGVSDVAFLRKLCHDAGISLKASSNMIVLFDQIEYEAKAEVLKVVKGDGSYSDYKLRLGAADSEYTSCRVRHVDPGSGQLIQGTAVVPNYKPNSKNNQQYEVRAKVTSAAEAKALAAKILRDKNKHERTAVFSFKGNPDLVAGMIVTLENWGLWSGKYIISKAIHSVNNAGYTTQVKLRHTLEGY